jgi:methionine sulfoxide reductase heme-binding subunit
MVDRLYLWVVSRRILVLRLFLLVNILLCILIGFGYRMIVLGIGNDPNLTYRIGSKAADIAVLFLIATSIPGIARRFHLQHKFIMLCMLFRRQLGIATFMFALVHVCYITLFPEIFFHAPLIATNLQNLAGWTTFLLLIPLFLTSNDVSVRRMGTWWHKVHAIIYGILWVLVVHTFFSEESWFTLIGITAVAQIGSFLYAKFRK